MAKTFSSILKWQGAAWYVPSYQLNGDKHWLRGSEYNPTARYFGNAEEWYADISEVQEWRDGEGFVTTEIRGENLQWA